MATDITHESNGLTTKLKTNVKIVPCPDVNGEFTVEATVDVSASAGGKQQSGKLDVKVTGQLNDNAELASSSTDIRLKRDGLGMGAFVDSSISYGSDGTASTKLNDFNWFTTKPEDFTDNAQLAAIFGLMIKQYLLDAVEAGYTSGRCVEIGYGVSPGTTGLQPGSSATITARPRGKQDGVPTGGTVQALLSAGEKSVDPSSTRFRSMRCSSTALPTSRTRRARCRSRPGPSGVSGVSTSTSTPTKRRRIRSSVVSTTGRRTPLCATSCSRSC